MRALELARRHGGVSESEATPTENNAGEFAEFGDAVRLRAWCICRGRQTGWKCNTFTMARGWVIDWVENQKRKCCRVDSFKKYKMSDGMIGQLRLRDQRCRGLEQGGIGEAVSFQQQRAQRSVGAQALSKRPAALLLYRVVLEVQKAERAVDAKRLAE